MEFEKKIKMVHLQLTLRCNLNCSFCGQWGKLGYMHNRPPYQELSVKEWKRVIDSINNYSRQNGIKPQVTIWGGEPLLYEGVDDVLLHLKNCGFEVGIVTNGLLLNKHIEVINDTVKTLSVSIDGPQEVHETIRGKKGIYEKIMRNMAQVNTRRVKTVCMFTITEQNYNYISTFPFELEKRNFKMALYQNLIFMTEPDARQYKEWLKSTWGIHSSHADSWIKTDFGGWLEKLPEQLRMLEENIAKKRYSIEVKLFPSEATNQTILSYYYAKEGLHTHKKEKDYCWSPFLHINVAPNGDVQLCVDFNDVSVGNVRECDISDIFHNEKAELFRREIIEGHNPACKRCPWRFDTSFCLE